MERKMSVTAWGIIEDGQLWPSACETRKEALSTLAEAVCNLANEKAGSEAEWSVRVVRVTIDLDAEKQ
jgi:hypothetical protein